MKNSLTFKRTQIFKGAAISGGHASGRIHIIPVGPGSGGPVCLTSSEETAEEIARIKQAFQLLLVVIEYAEGFLTNHLSEDATGLFAMQKVLLEEPVFRDRVISSIREAHLRAPQAIRKVIEEYKNRFAASGHETVRDRILDLEDLWIGLIDALDRPRIFLKNGGLGRRKKQRVPRIAVTRDLTTRFVMEQNLQGAIGILTENGGKTSHAAILCRALGIPCVSSLKNLMIAVENGAPVLVDGDKGRVVIPVYR
jgi:phosphotransferase system enzyme I (PtsI)